MDCGGPKALSSARRASPPTPGTSVRRSQLASSRQALPRREATCRTTRWVSGSAYGVADSEGLHGIHHQRVGNPVIDAEDIEQAVAAVAETVGNLPWDTLSTETAQKIRTPRSMQDRLKATTLTVRVFDENKPLVSKRIHVELIDNSNSDNLQSLAQLTCWSFPDSQPKTQ